MQLIWKRCSSFLGSGAGGGSPCPRTGGVEVGHCWGSRSASPWGHLWAHGAFPKSWEKVEVLGEVQGG